MELILERKYKKEGYTIGNLYIASHPQPLSPGTSPHPSPKERGNVNTLSDSGASNGQDNKSASPWGRAGGVAGAGWFCNTLEPPIGTPLESVTIGSKKAIADGTYEIALLWSQRFKKRLPFLTKVPGRSAILIHPGNYPRDTVGCILVGKNTRKGMVTDSTTTTDKLREMISQAILRGETVRITVG